MWCNGCKQGGWNFCLDTHSNDTKDDSFLFLMDTFLFLALITEDLIAIFIFLMLLGECFVINLFYFFIMQSRHFYHFSHRFVFCLHFTFFNLHLFSHFFVQLNFLTEQLPFFGPIIFRVIHFDQVFLSDAFGLSLAIFFLLI